MLEAEERGVQVFSMLFNAPEARLGTTFHHKHIDPKVLQRRLNGYLTFATRDNEEVVEGKDF